MVGVRFLKKVHTLKWKKEIQIITKEKLKIEQEIIKNSTLFNIHIRNNPESSMKNKKRRV